MTSTESPDRPDPPARAESDPKSIGEAIVGLARIAELAVATHDLSMTQYRARLHLQLGRSIQSELAVKLAVSRQNLTRVMDVLVERQLVERVNDPHDRRRVMTTLTARGVDALRNANEEIRTLTLLLLGDLPSQADEDHVLHSFKLVNLATQTAYERLRHGPDLGAGRRTTRPPLRPR